MAEAVFEKPTGTIDGVTPAAGWTSGEVVQLPSGRAAVVQGLKSPTSGEPVTYATSGRFTVAKTSGVVALKGAPAWFDRSANSATPLRAAAGADFFLGIFTEDVASGTTTAEIDLNVQPSYTIDALKDPADTVIVLTAGTPALTMGPGYAKLAFSATAEAQKVDLLSKQSVPVTIPFIVEGRAAIYDIGDEGSVDINIGLANATHASDADSITESVFLHLDGTALSILAESDDGSTEVAATDTTVDAVDDTYFDFAFDCRDLADIQVYINGVLMLPNSVFKLDAATGPMKLLAHIEKGANDTLGEIRIEKLALRAMDVE